IARSLAQVIQARMGRFSAPILRKPGEISWLDQVHAETRRRGGGGNRAIDHAVKTFFECRTAKISSISFVISLSPLRVSASPREQAFLPSAFLTDTFRLTRGTAILYVAAGKDVDRDRFGMQGSAPWLGSAYG